MLQAYPYKALNIVNIRAALNNSIIIKVLLYFQNGYSRLGALFLLKITITVNFGNPRRSLTSSLPSSNVEKVN